MNGARAHSDTLLPPGCCGGVAACSALASLLRFLGVGKTRLAPLACGCTDPMLCSSFPFPPCPGRHRRPAQGHAAARDVRSRDPDVHGAEEQQEAEGALPARAGREIGDPAPSHHGDHPGVRREDAHVGAHVERGRDGLLRGVQVVRRGWGEAPHPLPKVPGAGQLTRRPRPSCAFGKSPHLSEATPSQPSSCLHLHAPS